MENAPLNHEADDEDDDLANGKKKKAESLGAWLVEAKPEEKDQGGNHEEKKPASVWEQLSRQIEQSASEPGDTEAAVEDVGEVDAPLNELSPVEIEYAEQQIVEAEMDVDEAIPEIEIFRHKIVEEHKTSDEALAETLDEIGIEEEPTDNAPHEITEPEGEIYIASDEAADEEVESPAATVTTPAASGSGSGSGGSGTGGPVGTAGGSGSGGSGSGGATPPTGAFGPMGGTPGVPTDPGAAPYIPGSTLRQPDYWIDASPVANLLIGGIVGYLLGRRRGRIKTEKRLLPIQKKLEKQVEALQQDITAKEDRIRKVVRQREEAQAANLRHQAPEANQLHSKLPAEKIGQVLITAESRAPVKAETQPGKPDAQRVEKASVEKQVETLSRSDLLEMSEKIVIEATTLRQLYETHLIGEKGLRRIMIEHLRGGDVKRQLRRELVERQIDYERDPILRDRTPLNNTKNAGSVALKQMFSEVDKLSVGQAKEELAIYKAREAYEAADSLKNQRRRRIADFAMVTLITVLAVVVAILFMTRH